MVVPGALGLHDASGRPILESYQQRGATEQPDFPWGKPVSIEINPNDPVDRLEMAIALPPLGFQHFGHFMTDTAGWLSELLDPDTKLLELNQSGVPIIILGSGERSDLAALGIKRLFDPPADGILLAKELIRPLLCRKILLPQPTMVDRRAMDIRQCQAYVSITSRWYGIDPLEMRQRMTHDIRGDGIPKEKIYLSRTRMPDNSRKIFGEERLEKQLAARGWWIIHPETLPLQEQILALHQARVISGNIGSGFHTLMYFGQQARGKAVIGLGTDSIENDRYSWVYNFVNQFRVQGIDFWHLSCMTFEASTSGNKTYNHIRCYDLKLLYSPKRIARSMDRIARRVLNTTPPSDA